MAARHFVLVANLIAVRVHEAVAVAVIAFVCISARTVVIRGVRIIIACRAIRAACDFKFVARAVFVRVVEAVAVAVVTRIGIITVARIRRGSVKVARAVVLAARHFVLIANLIAVRVHEAVAVAVISVVRVSARTVVVRGVRIIIACRAIRAACDFKFVARAVFVRVVEAVAVAVVTRIGIITVARIRRGSVKVARAVVLATRHFVLVANLIAVIIKKAVACTIVACDRVCAGTIVIRGVRCVIACRAIRAACDFKFVANAVLVSVVQA